MFTKQHTLKGVSTLQQMYRRFAGVLLSILCLLGVSAVTATPAHADTTLCSGNSFSACTSAGYTAHGYENHYTSSYWNAYSGHNCTNYAGYMLTQNGDGGHGVAMGNGGEWDNTIAAHPEWGYAMNGTPAVGSIAQWDPYAGYTGAAGHVAYVESVSANSITVSEDNYPSGPFRWRVINTGSSDWPSRFLHIKDVAGATSGFNNLQLSTVGTDGKVYTLGQTSPGTWSPNWAVINGNVKSTSVTTTPDGLQHIAALGGDGNIYIVHQQANKQWGAWSQVQAQVTQVAIAATPEGKLHLAAIGTDGKVYVLSQASTGGSWSPNWVVINANNLTSISMTTNPANGKLNIAVTGTDSNIYVARQSASTGQWGAWSQVQAQVTQVAIAATPEGKLHLAARGTNGKVYVLDEVNTGGPWSPNWTEINGNITSVAMVSTGNGKLHIASKGGDGNIYIVSQSASTGQWGGWSQVQAQVTQVAITTA